MAIRELQNVFSYGELDPKLIARPDTEFFYKGARTANNVLVQPQGGVTRRFGTDYLFTVEDTQDSAAITDADEVAGHVFEFSPAKKFLIIARPFDRDGSGAGPGVSFDIYLNTALQTSVTTTDYTIAQIVDIYMISSQDRVIVLHDSVQPHQLVRTNDTTWTLSAITFPYYPTYDFSIIDGTSYRGATVTFTPSATSGAGITLTAANYTYTSGHVGGIFIGGGGIFRITSVNAGGTVATGDTVEDFSAASAIKGVNSLLLEAAWGDYTGGTPAGSNRGWPSRGEFFQNRLILGRTLTLKNTVSFSSTADFYNFDDSEALDTNSFSLSIGTDGNDECQDIIGSRAIVVFGLSGIYSSSLFLEQPVTPGNIFLNEQDKTGSDAVQAQVMDNQIFFVDENKQKINAAQYDLTSGVVNVIDASVLSPQLINQPVSTAVYRPEDNNGSILLVANTDGTMAMFQSLLNQQIQGWTKADTQGLYKKFFAKKEEAYSLVERSIGTGATTAGACDNVYIGNPDFESFTDITSEASDAASDVTIFSQDDEYLLFGHSIPFYRIAVALNTAASATISPTFEYLNKFGVWTTFTPTDGSTGFTGAGTIVWDLDADTPDWRAINISEKVTGTDNRPLPLGASLPADSINGNPRKFWMRIRRTADSLVTNPIEDTLLINCAQRLHIEQLDFNEYMDSTESTTSDANGLITSLTHLQGHQVWALVDEVPEGPFFVDTSGQITVSGQSSDVKVGINYIPTLIPMPIVGRQFYSQNVYNPKQIKGIFVDYYESLNIVVNGKELPQLSLNNFVLDQTPIPVTGFDEVSPLTGWNPRAEIIINQELPQPMTIIGIGYRLEIS